ncbi:MAG: reverse transcriptase-like protein [Nitrososphaerota archaeon]|jgi:lactoylglutathione lyase|uniref:reverse transcriptase-like protein n=1 Tax=Candidatus Bathycorpusculum sp. TaxID=2994959 RepID=UPI00282A23FC|nr:reverse transcriptase-like protein [Candidatus Termitimicrobium sp.]MCL2431938.1 reverse transcriptase-like protein [Candidatus Termitimicrobium sp.]MDR0493862.1 reverse transcriptase-like protein [Nitrososphaerota archaeon]
MSQLVLYSDGGARGNPGPAAAAYLALNEAGVTVKTDARSLGVSTNNQAEYAALLMALQFAAEYGAAEVVCYLDSELVVKQLNGVYTVRNSELQRLWRQVQQRRDVFKKISFQHVRRSNPCIVKADALVNKVLDDQRSGDKPSLCHEKQNPVLVHASIRTSNMKRSVDFYSHFLGLEVTRRFEVKETNAEIVFLQDPQRRGCVLELTFYRDQKQYLQADYENRIFDHLGFEVADIQRTLTAMKKANIIVTDEPRRFNEDLIIAFVEDPDGTLIELIEHKQL